MPSRFARSTCAVGAIAAALLLTGLPLSGGALAQSYPTKPVYKGIPEALTAVVAGSVQFNFSPVVNTLALRVR